MTPYAGRAGVLVLALPRGGVPVAAEIAAALRAPLDVFLVRKLGVPFHPELAMGAIAEGGVTILTESLIHNLHISSSQVDRVAQQERLELDRRSRLFRGTRPAAPVTGRTLILVDDGLATGATMEAAIAALRTRTPSRIVVAVPVGAPETCDRLARIADELVVLVKPVDFQAVGEWYDDFTQNSDQEVIAILNRA